ncbi:MAG: ankyrin repeat domain-containing protein [Verrucomicrobiae bacterium]|nr:ankyrin repeat domain-containing protein [Verrucomicrobiae bacterium]
MKCPYFSFSAATKRCLNLPVFTAFGIVLTLGLVGCSDPQETAVESLKEMRYGFSVDDYLLAAEAGDFAAIRLFQEAGMEPDSVDAAGNTALMRAAAGGRLELVEKFLDAGADPRAKNAAGRTPLMFSAEGGREDVLRALLERGADLTETDQEGWTALKLAAFNGRADVVELLAGKVGQETLDQVLLVASFKGDTAVIDQLLNHGAYINTRSPEDLTPLMIAAQAGHEDAVKLLLQSQANPYALDDSEHTAADLALAAGHVELSDMLLDPTSVLEVAESGADADSLLVEGNPLISEMAISDALHAFNGGESPAPEEGEDAVSAAAGSDISEQSMPIQKPGGKPRMASINGRVIGNETEVPVEMALTDTLSIGSSGEPVTTSRDGVVVAPTSKDAVQSLQMKSYREEPLPVMLKGVESGKGEAATAQVRVLSSHDATPVTVKEGEIIPGTDLKIASMDSKFISSKMGKGALVDVSSIMVEDTKSGAKHLLVKDVPGRSTETYATLNLPGSPFDYVVKNGDVFRAVTAEDGEQDYEVLDVRPTQVVIRNVGTEEVVTVNRDGIAMR